MPKCRKCGYENTRDKFRFLNYAEVMGPNVYRHCPKCKAAVYCEELEEDEREPQEDVWGAGSLRGRVFTRPRKSGKDDSEKK